MGSTLQPSDTIGQDEESVEEKVGVSSPMRFPKVSSSATIRSNRSLAPIFSDADLEKTYTRSNVQAEASQSTVSWEDPGALEFGKSEHFFQERRFKISLRNAVVVSITVAVGLSWVGLFLPLALMTQNRYKTMTQYLGEVVKPQSDFIDMLVENKTDTSYTSLLLSIGAAVKRYITEPTDEAMNAVWLTMRTENHLNKSWIGRSAEARQQIGYSAWLQLLHQLNVTNQVVLNFGLPEVLPIDQHVDELIVAFDTGEVIAVATDISSAQYGRFVPKAFQLDVDRNDVNVMRRRAIDPETGIPGDDVLDSWSFNITGRPYYSVQADYAKHAAPNTPTKKLWSRLYRIPFTGMKTPEIGLAVTQPVAYCGTYDCFQGVVSAMVSMRYVSVLMTEALNYVLSGLRRNFLRGGAPQINNGNSNIFVVYRKSHQFPEQQGLLIGAANAQNDLINNLVNVSSSQQPIIRSTAFAILHQVGEWNSSQLSTMWSFAYRLDAVMENPPRFELCSTSSVDGNCLRVGTCSVEVDDATEWLVVTVMPAGVFGDSARATAQRVAQSVDAHRSQWASSLHDEEVISVGLFACMSAASLCMALVMGMVVSRPLRHLSSMRELMRRLGEFDFAHNSGDLNELKAGHRSFIKEVSQLQSTFCRLSRGIETFAHFVPESVVRDIVGGDGLAMQPHVSRRTVTIMFTDIGDFTAISESLSQKELLFLLTQYLTAMTNVAEAHSGVVTEILGDGLLIFWNTPDDVPDHAAKACLAALAMQSALISLNRDLVARDLPRLSIRIGLHTGSVLSGNIGSTKKMKFGCLGDPVNLASRLEGLCKPFGVGVICSGATYAEIEKAENKSSGLPSLICRRIALVQVKGKREPTWIHEVMGISDKAVADILSSEACNGAQEAKNADDVDRTHILPTNTVDLYFGQSVDPEDLRERANAYEDALVAYHEARFADAEKLALEVLRNWPDDVSAQRVLSQARKYIPNGESQCVWSAEEVAAWTGAIAMTEK